MDNPIFIFTIWKNTLVLSYRHTSMHRHNHAHVRSTQHANTHKTFEFYQVNLLNNFFRFHFSLCMCCVATERTSNSFFFRFVFRSSSAPLFFLLLFVATFHSFSHLFNICAVFFSFHVRLILYSFTQNIQMPTIKFS